MSGSNGPTTPSSHASVNPSNTNTMPSDEITRCVNKDMAWEWGEQRDPLKKANIWCKLCDKKISGGGITRLKQHLTHTGGQVSGCPKVTVNIKKRVMASIRERDQIQLEKKRNREILRSNAADLSDVKEDMEDEDTDDVQAVGSKGSVSKKKKFVGSSNTRGPMDVLFNTKLEKTKQSSLDKNNPIKEKLKMRAWEKFATWAYSVGLPFNAVRDDGFQDMIDAIGDYGRAGCYLNPAIFHGENHVFIRNNRDLITGLYNAIDRLVPDDDENDIVRCQLNLYIDSTHQFGSAAAIRARTKVAPYIWWRSYGIDTFELQSFAISVLSQTCSASPCERNWSTFDNLHSKKRNHLLQQKLNDLVYIQYNTRLQKRFNSLKTNKSLDPILLRDVDENDDWVIPTEDELQEFVDGKDGLFWSVAQEAMGGNEDDTIVDVDALADVDSEEEFQDM